MKFPSADSFTRHTACPVADPPLTELERRVVRLGRADADRGNRSRPRSARLSALLATLTGVRRIQPLAEERLEALRRYACATRRREAGTPTLADQLRAFGFSADAIGTATALARR